MVTTSVLSWDKNKVQDVQLQAEVFEAPVRKDLLQTVVRWQLACRRQGTHASKNRSLVSGGGKKPFKQKGTGNARQGSIRSPLMPGGGVAFGPQVRSYSYTLPRKVKQAGLKSALSYLVANGKLFVVDAMKSEGKTNELAKRLKAFGVEKAVLVDSELDLAFKRAAQNLPNYRYYSADGLNVYDLLKYDAAIVTASALEKICARCGLENA